VLPRRIKHTWTFDISEFLLLAPTSNGCVSNRDNKIIKAAVFEFIEISGRKL